jgi:hypothetical protein
VEISYKSAAEPDASGLRRLKARVNRIEIRDSEDQPIRAVRARQRLQIVAEIEGNEPVEGLLLYVEIATATVIRVASMVYNGSEIQEIGSGDRVEVRFDFECPLAVGEYMLRYYLGSQGNLVQPTTQDFPFSVVSGPSMGTLVAIAYDSTAQRLKGER